SGATTSIGNAAPGTNVASGALSASIPGGTSAEIFGTVYAHGAVHVRAADNLTVFGVAGAVAGGFVGVGVAVIILNVASQTDAGIGPNGNVTALGGILEVTTSMNENFFGLAVAGGFGFVGLGAQVIVVNDSGTQNAHIDDGAIIGGAAGGLVVSTNAMRNIQVLAIGVTSGAFSPGAAIAVANISGDALASIGNVTVTASGINVSVNDWLSAPMFVVSVSGGVGVGMAAGLAFVSISGKASASSGAHGTVGSGGYSVTASSFHNVSSNTVNVATGAGAVGVT